MPGSGGPSLLAGVDVRVVLVELGADLGNDRVERPGIVDCQLGEALPIQADLCQTEPVDQSAVAEPPHLGGGAQSDDEELAKLTLASPTVAKGEHTGPEEGLLGGFQQAPTPSDETLGGMEDPLLPLIPRCTTLGTHRSALSQRCATGTAGV